MKLAKPANAAKELTQPEKRAKKNWAVSVADAAMEPDAQPQLIEEGGVLVLASISAEIEDWESLVEREREERIASLSDIAIAGA